MSKEIYRQRSILALAITSVLAGWSSHGLATDIPPITQLSGPVTINEGERIYNESGSAIDITTGGDASYGITINGEIASANAAAISITGGAQAEEIINNGTVTGGMVDNEQIALDTRSAGNGISYTMGEGSVTNGNLYLNENNIGSEVIVKSGSDSGQEATFNGYLISGAKEFRLSRRSALILAAQDRSIVVDLQDDGNFTLSRDTILIMELDGRLAAEDAVLSVNGGFVVEENEKAGLVVRGDVSGAAGTRRLIEADTITGYDNLEISSGWLLSVNGHELMTDDDGRQFIEADIVFNGNVTTEELAQRAEAGGADATEVQVMKTFGTIALDGTVINPDAITFASSTTEALANLLNSAATDSETARLAGELTPDRSGAVTHAIQRSQNQQLDTIDKRLAMHRSGQQGDGFWLDVYSYQGEKNVNGRIDGYNVNGFSANFGMDKSHGDHFTFGTAFGINRQDIDTKIYGTNYIVDDFQWSLYGSFNQDMYFATAALNAGYSSFVSSRTIGEQVGYSGDSKAEGDFSAMNIALRMSAGLKFELASISLQPMIATELSHLKVSDYHESGSPAALGYDDQSVSQAKVGAGLYASSKITLKSATLTPSLMAMGWYDYNADDEQLNAYAMADHSALINLDSVTGSAKERYEVRAALDHQLDSGGQIGLAVGYQAEHDYSDTRVQLQYRYLF